jgi:hypothetical protein
MSFKQFLKESTGDEYDAGKVADIKQILKDHLENTVEWAQDEFEDFEHEPVGRAISKLDNLIKKFGKDLEAVWKEIAKYQ